MKFYYVVFSNMGDVKGKRHCRSQWFISPALYRVLKLLLLQTTKQLPPVSSVLSVNPQRELLNAAAPEIMILLSLF